MPVILLLLTNNKPESDFEIKANYFNSFLASTCAPLINNSTVPIFEKSLEKLPFNFITDFLEENNLLNSNQSGFRPNDSCGSQLLSIVHGINSSFNCYPSI